MSSFVGCANIWLFLSLIFLADGIDSTLDQANAIGQTNTVGHAHYGADIPPLWPNLPSLQRSLFNNIWGGLFHDYGYQNGYCGGGNCGPTPSRTIPLHHTPLEPLKALKPIWNLFGAPAYDEGYPHGYNYNHGGPNYSNSYGGGYQNQDPNYGKANENYIPPSAPAPAEISYESPEPVYEAPRSEAPRPAYQEPDCSNNKCGHVVFQPIIYVGPNTYDKKEISQESSEEETTEEPSPTPETTKEESNHYTEHEEHHSKEKDTSEKEDKYEEDQHDEVEKKENYEIPSHAPQHNPPTFAPQIQYYSQPPCAQPWSQVALPVLTYMLPAAPNQYQAPLYYPPTTLTNYSPYYGSQSYQPCSACNNLGSIHYTAPNPPAPTSYASVPVAHTDQPYRACPELFNKYNQLQSFNNYY